MVTVREAVLISRDTRVLVTGGAGFIGSHLVERLVGLGAQVTIIDNLSTGNMANLRNVRTQTNLVLHGLHETLRDGMVRLQDYEIVFHLAANSYVPPSVEKPLFDFEANLLNSLMLLEGLRSIRNPPRLIYASSAAVYGNPISLPIKETDLTFPISPYGVSKLAAERYTAVYSQIYGIPATSLRLFSVYGPRQRKQVVYDLLVKVLNNPTHLEVLGDGTQERDFTYVGDLVDALLLVAEKAPGKGEVYNVASGRAYTIAELIDTICKVCEAAPEVRFTGSVRPGDPERWAVDISAIRALGFEPRTELVAGIRAIKSWYEGAQVAPESHSDGKLST